MKALLRRHCVLLALLIFWVPVAHAQELPRVQQIEIKHIGPPAVSDALIKANIRLKIGDPYSRSGVDDDVRNLYSTGYFYNIRVAEERQAEGVKLVYVVQGRPLITDVKFEGNTKFSEVKLLKKIRSGPVISPDKPRPAPSSPETAGKKNQGTKVGEPLDERRLFEDAKILEEMYQKAGYQKTKVEYILNINENAGRGTVIFKITEAPKVRIVDIVFENTTVFPRKKLAKEIKTRRHWMFSWMTGSGKLKDDQFEDDKEKLAEFYRNEGYLDFEIKDIKFDYLTPSRLVIRLDIFEGKQYKVGSVAFKGNALYTTNELAKALKMEAGSTFSPKGLQKDIEKLQDAYGFKGYIDARIAAVRNANTETGNLDLTYQIDEKDKSYVEKIEIKGNTRTKDKVLRRELSVSPGDPFNMVFVKLSKERLEGTEFFSKVETQIEETDVPNRKNLVVAVEESGKTGNIQFGAGFSSVDSIVGFVEVTQGNFDLFNPPFFTGGGQKFRVRASVGTKRQDYIISFVEPWLFDRKLSFGVDLYHRTSSYQSSLYDQVQTGGKLSLSRAIGSDFLIGTVNYTIENLGVTHLPGLTQVITTTTNSQNTVTSTTNYVDPVSSALRAEAGYTLVSKVGGALAYDTRGGGQLPNRGQRTELSAEIAGSVLGGDADFYKLELRSSWYFKGFFDKHVIEFNSGLGVVDNYDNSTRVPLFNRFFMGGPNSLRGFRYPQVGPRDSTGEPIGGNTYFIGSLEYSLPIIERLRLALFYDVGNVYARAYDFNFGSYYDNYGLGVRINIPQIGPLRLDYGIPLHSDSTLGKTGKFQFSVGYSRQF